MKFFLVDVKSITPSKPVEQFDKAEVEKLADLILECNGLLKPLVLKPTGPESYVVIQGDMEFHAAVRAREKDPRKGEMVNAFVIAPKAEETVLKQIQTLQGAATPPPEYLINHDELSLKEASSLKKDTESVCRKEDSLSSQLLAQLQAQVKNVNLKIEDLTSSLPSQLIRMIQQLLERDVKEVINTCFKEWENKIISPIPDGGQLPVVLTQEVLSQLTWEQIKQLAKQRKIKIKGKRPEMERLLLATEKTESQIFS
ncbi:MAG: hypothetical protein BWK80_00365 [Desulfobacteraceae bacterium IS3]|nr:MAG: hypothetical protein BWK80_00365 [Desulfobacteraceae bacterium IS3]